MSFQGPHHKVPVTDHNQSLSLCCSDRMLGVVSRTMWWSSSPRAPSEFITVLFWQDAGCRFKDRVIKFQSQSAIKSMGLHSAWDLEDLVELMKKKKVPFFFFFQFPSHRVLPCMLTNLISDFFSDVCIDCKVWTCYWSPLADAIPASSKHANERQCFAYRLLQIWNERNMIFNYYYKSYVGSFWKALISFNFGQPEGSNVVCTYFILNWQELSLISVSMTDPKIIRIIVVISIALYLTDKCEHTTLYKINKNGCIKPQK